MSVEIIKNRIRSYSPQSSQEEENAIKEIYQEIALSSLARQGFFKIAGFQGGTCLRIVYHLNRFSEDLDFTLLQTDKTFIWKPFLNGLREEFAIYGIDLEVISPEKASKSIQKAIIKSDSFARIFQLRHGRNRSDKQKIIIKFEVDINPPEASAFKTHHLDFPIPFSIVTQDKPSLFASKCHALLCRPFVKGRDWYDFLWYVGNQTSINFEHLKFALIQTENWHWDNNEPLAKGMFIELLKKKAATIDWKKAALDVAALLKPIDREMLKGWDQELFITYVNKLNDYLRKPLEKAVIFRIANGPAPQMDDKLFSGAISDFDDDEMKRINASDTFCCQSLKSIHSLEDTKKYSVIFLHLNDPGAQKTMSAHTHCGKMESTAYIPGQIYELPGWFIKDWNGRKLIHYHNIYRALFWFQPLDMTTQKTIEAIKRFAKKSR